jgi:hypothetical protein
MRLTLDKPDLELMARLARNEPKLRDFLVRKFNEQVKFLVRSTADPHMHVAQGRAQVLDELIAALDEAKRL